MKNLIHIIFLLIPISIFSQDWHQEKRIYEYDNLNRLAKVVFHSGIVYEYNYDNLGNRLGKNIEVELPANNYNITTTGLSCINSQDGLIKIKADRKNNYNIHLVSEDNNLDETHTLDQYNLWELFLSDAKGGEYFVHITIKGISEEIYKKTFILNLDEPEPLDVSAKTSSSEKSKYTITMDKGTPPFTIKQNNEILAVTDESEFSFIANHGDSIEVTSSKSCEGVYKEIIDITNIILARPNPTKGEIAFEIPLSTRIKRVDVEVYDTRGRLLKKVSKNISNYRVKLSLAEFSDGVYFVNISSLSDKKFKIVKN